MMASMMNDTETQGELMLGDIRSLWPKIRPALEEIQEEQKTDWMPEDIYHWVMADQATLYATDDGFSIVQRGQNPVTKEKFLFLLICYSWSKGSNIWKYMKAFEELGRNIGASYIETWSQRRGLERSGFDLAHCVYRRRL